MKILIARLRFIRDLFWPLPDPIPSDIIDKRNVALATAKAAIPTENSTLDEHIKTYATFLEQEEERRQSVESRLTSIMGLSSIAGTIAFGTILAQLAETLHIPSGPVRWVAILGSLYLVMQICSAIFAAVCGIARRPYYMLTPDDLLRKPDKDMTGHLRELAAKYLDAIEDHQSQNNIKVTWMAAAHKSMRQFLCGLLLFALFGTYFAIKAPPAARDDLFETIKKSNELQKILRGPEGPPGSSGPIGPQGDPCKIHGRGALPNQQKP
jgi:hypothetical protein